MRARQRMLALVVAMAAICAGYTGAAIAAAQDPKPDTESEAPAPRRADAPPKGIDLTPDTAGERVIPSTVNSNCQQDVTAKMKAFVTVGGPMKLAPGGCYIVNEKLVIIAGSLDGQGSTIRQNRAPLEKCNQHAGFVELKGQGSVSNLNLVREGPGGYSECHYAEHGIEIRGAANTAVANVRMTNIWGDCIYFQGAQGSLVKNLRCDSNGRQGGAASKARNVLIDGFVVSKSSRSGFDFEANGTSAEDGIYNFTIQNFDITKTNLIAFPSQGYNAPQDGITLRNGRIRDSLSAIYDRQVRPSSNSCRGSVQRKNWTVENVIVDPTTSGAGYGGKGLAVFCGTQNVRVSRLTMPGGEVVMEGSSGRLIVENSCVKGVRAVEPTTQAMIQKINVSAPPCGGTPPPPSSTTTTTRPPTPSSTTTTTTRPPVTTAPAGSVEFSLAECARLVGVLAEMRKIQEATDPRPGDAIRLGDDAHDSLLALCP